MSDVFDEHNEARKLPLWVLLNMFVEADLSTKGLV